MNKAFNTNTKISIDARDSLMKNIKWLAGQSCHIVAGDVMELNDHPLRGEVFAKIDSGEKVFS